MFDGLRRLALELHDEFHGLKTILLLLDGRLGQAPNGGDDTGRNPTDRGKKGTKISALTDSTGIPLSIISAPANTHDSKLVDETLTASLVALPVGATLELDRGYRGEPVRKTAAEHGLEAKVIEHPKRPRKGKKKPVDAPTEPPAEGVRRARSRRSPVECLFSKLNRHNGIKNRRLRLKRRWLALLQLACAILTFRETSRRVARPS